MVLSWFGVVCRAGQTSHHHEREKNWKSNHVKRAQGGDVNFIEQFFNSFHPSGSSSWGQFVSLSSLLILTTIDEWCQRKRESLYFWAQNLYIYLVVALTFIARMPALVDHKNGDNGEYWAFKKSQQNDFYSLAVCCFMGKSIRRDKSDNTQTKARVKWESLAGRSIQKSSSSFVHPKRHIKFILLSLRL